MILPCDDTGVRRDAPDHCLYCKQPLLRNAGGEIVEHAADCVVPRRTVVLALETWLVVDVPRGWTEEQIRFYYNDSSHCAGNEIYQLAEEEDRVAHSCCSCFRTEMRYLREATAEDHEATRWADDETLAAEAKAKAKEKRFAAQVVTAEGVIRATLVTTANDLAADAARVLRDGEALLLRREAFVK